MVPPEARRFTPDPRAAATYNELYAIYRRLHDAFGNVTVAANLGSAMKDLLAIRAKATA
jgi:L-ribulokinase